MNPAPNKSSCASCALQYYGDGGNAGCVKRVRSGEVLKRDIWVSPVKAGRNSSRGEGREWLRQRRKHKVGKRVQRRMLGQGHCPAS